MLYYVLLSIIYIYSYRVEVKFILWSFNNNKNHVNNIKKSQKLLKNVITTLKYKNIEVLIILKNDYILVYKKIAMEHNFS